MPAVEAGVGEVVLSGNGVLVELLVVRVDEGEVGEAFVFGDEAVADDLDFGLVGDGLEVWVQDAAFGVEGLAVAVADGGGIEAVREVVLGFGGAGGLVFEDDDVLFVEGVADEGEVIVCGASVSTVLSKCRRPGYLLRRLPFHGVLPLNPTFSSAT